MKTLSEEKNLKNLTYEELSRLVEKFNEPPYRARQLYKWLFSKGASEISEMTDISKEFRSALKEDGWYLKKPRIVKTRVSKDSTCKLLLELEDGLKIESVLIPNEKRLTLCVSTQTGCALNCQFCMTGTSSAGRNLKLSELIEEMEAANEIIKSGQVKGLFKITNVVLMGMGEPLLNFEEVVKFLEILIDSNGMGFSPRRITVSTAGIVPAIEKLGMVLPAVNLAVSLNAATDEVRNKLMPINKKYPIKELLNALRCYPLPKNRHITIEYVLINGVNDSLEDAKRLAGLLKGIQCKINLIPFNPFPGSSYKRPDEETIEAFREILNNARYTVHLRISKGLDIEAACGQLAGQG